MWEPFQIIPLKWYLATFLKLLSYIFSLLNVIRTKWYHICFVPFDERDIFSGLLSMSPIHPLSAVWLVPDWPTSRLILPFSSQHIGRKSTALSGNRTPLSGVAVCDSLHYAMPHLTACQASYRFFLFLNRPIWHQVLTSHISINLMPNWPTFTLDWF